VLVPVWITNAGGVAGIRVAVDYDPEVLHFVQGRLFRECALTEHWAAALAHEDSPGRVVISAAGLQPLGDGPGVLFAFELEATSELTDEEPLQFDPAFSRLNDGLLAADFLDGSLHAAPAANLSLPVDEVLLPAQTVAVPVTIIGPAPLNGFRVAIRFDERLWELMPEPVSLADTIASAFEILVVNAEQPGLVLVSAAGSAPASAVDGVLVHINLRPRDGLANGTLLPLEWDPYLTRLQDGAIAARLHDGRFIFRTTTTPTPTATQTPSPTPTPCCSTRSGVIDRLLVRNDKDPSAFDANGDGVLDAADTAWCRE
jgi:hypothetical protein